MGRWTLSRTAWRGRRASPRSLGAPCRRLEPLTRLVRHWLGSEGPGVLSGVSSTTGGPSAHWMRAVAAASGSSTPTSMTTSGNAARGGVCTGPVLSLTAVRDTELASRKGLVICQFLLKARQGDPEK